LDEDQTKSGKKTPRQAQENERLYDPDPDPDQHRGGAVCVPAVLDHHRLLQNRCGHQCHYSGVVAQRVGAYQLSEAVCWQKRPSVAAGSALWQYVQRRRRAHLLLGRPRGPRCHPLDGEHRVHGGHVHDPYLHHRRYGWLCPGKKALCGPAAAVHSDRMCHGSA